jgi:hypothetical protein
MTSNTPCPAIIERHTADTASPKLDHRAKWTHDDNLFVAAAPGERSYHFSGGMGARRRMTAGTERVSGKKLGKNRTPLRLLRWLPSAPENRFPFCPELARKGREASSPACVLFTACPDAQILMEVRPCSHETAHDRGWILSRNVELSVLAEDVNSNRMG